MKQPLHAAALAAYLDGKLSVLPRARTVRPAADYEQDLERAGSLFLPVTESPVEPLGEAERPANL